MKSGVTFLWIILIQLICIPVRSYPQTVEYDITQISIEGTYGFSINDSTEVVGVTWDFWPGGTSYSYLWKDNNIQYLSALGTAYDVNNNSEIVGNVWNDPTYWYNGTTINLGRLPNTVSGYASAINDSGKIVGLCYDDSAGFYPFYYDGSMQALPIPLNCNKACALDISNTNVVVGYSDPIIGLGYRATRWVNGNPELIAAGVHSGAIAINNNNIIVGYYATGPGEISAPAMWENGTLTLLNLIPGAEDGVARGVNDSLVIVGGCYGNLIGSRAFIWKDGISKDLSSLIPADSNITLTNAYSVNNKGEIVCSGTRAGSFYCFFLKPINIKITSPKVGDKFMAGEVDTIKWTGGKANQQIYIQYSTDGGNTWPGIVDLYIPADSGKWPWDVPDDLIGRHSLLRIVDHSGNQTRSISDTFKIKPYIITRVDQNGEYVKYDINTDKWGFWNDDPDVWPQSWWQTIDYNGIDPITGKQYSRWQGDSVYTKAASSDHPDWISFVRAFGINACYADPVIGIYQPKALQLWKSQKGNWGGSCFGIAISNALAFENRDEFQTVYPDFPDIISPYLVNSDTNVIKVINELFTHQFGNPHEANLVIALQNTPNQTLDNLKALLREDTVTIRTLSFLSNDSTDPGGHAIVGYKITQDDNIDDRFYIHVYDNSHPNVLNAVVRIDTLDSGGLGSWYTPYAWQNWGGNQALFLEDNASTFFSNPTLPKKSLGCSPFVLSENVLKILPSSNLTPMITDAQGNQTGIGSSGLVTEIPESYPLIKRNGSSGPPYGYYLPAENYSIRLDNFSTSYVNVLMLTGNKSFEYERYAATETQTDRLFFDGGVSLANPDNESKTIKLLNIVSDTTQMEDRLFVVRHLDLLQNDSVKIENVDNDKLKLISYGSAKDYGIGLEYTSESNFGLFGHLNVDLSANTTHTFIPNWSDITNSELTVYVDIGNNGTIDDTLYLQNQVTSVGDDQGSLIPTEYRLEQNYPNPFNNSTVIKYSILKAGVVTLKIYNAIGEEVTTIVNETKQLGNYEIMFNTDILPSGVYFYQLRAGNFVETKKMILMK